MSAHAEAAATWSGAPAEAKAGSSFEGAHACVDCGATPGSAAARAGCVHRGRWHSSFQDCNPRCAWKLGRANLGQCHFSCCYVTDPNASSCPANPTHRFAGAPAPSTSHTAEGSLFGVRDCPRYVVDLEAPAKERWQHVISDFADQLPSVVSMAEDILGDGIVASLASSIFAAAAKLGRVHLGDELKGIAKASGVPLGRVVLLQIAYEAFAACTSIIVDGPEGHPLHIRTMDWEMPELQPLTIEVDFMRRGQVVCRATTWAGYVGVLTGLRCNGFSVSVNYRRSKLGDENGVAGVLQNIKRGVAGHWPVSFLVREVLETETTFCGAVDALRMSELMAPVYLTIAGCNAGEGCVLARDREGASEDTTLEQDSSVSEALWHRRDSGGSGGGCASVVQTNMDIWRCDNDDENDDWQDICDSRARRRFAKAALSSLTSPPTMEDLWCLVSVAPCKAHDTVYTTAMVPTTSELVTRVRPTRAQQRAGRNRWAKALHSNKYERRRGPGATRQ